MIVLGGKGKKTESEGVGPTKVGGQGSNRSL